MWSVSSVVDGAGLDQADPHALAVTSWRSDSLKAFTAHLLAL